MDMYEYPEEFKRLSKRISDILKIVVERAAKMGVTAIYLMEDLATTKGLAMSPAMIREFCLDYVIDLVAIARVYNLPVLFHSDGTVSDLMEPLIDIVVCAVNPLQPHLNDAAEFKRRFGKQLAIYGGLDNCFIIPDGSPAEIRTHVFDVFEKLGRPDGGLIFSTHEIPLQTPKENVEAMIEAIKKCQY
jgi:uroporphyrinogen decarboxylase